MENKKTTAAKETAEVNVALIKPVSTQMVTDTQQTRCSGQAVIQKPLLKEKNRVKLIKYGVQMN